MIGIWELNVTGAMMRALVMQFVAAFVIAALVVGTIAAFDSSKPRFLQPVKLVWIDELPNDGRAELMSCADAPQACPGPYEPALSW
jgi:hypothetical protein